MGENRFAHGQTVSTVSSGVSDPVYPVRSSKAGMAKPLSNGVYPVRSSKAGMAKPLSNGVYPGSATKGKASFAATKGKASSAATKGKCPVESAEGGAAKPQFHRAATVGIDFFKGTRLVLREGIEDR